MKRTADILACSVMNFYDRSARYFARSLEHRSRIRNPSIADALGQEFSSNESARRESKNPHRKEIPSSGGILCSAAGEERANVSRQPGRTQSHLQIRGPCICDCARVCVCAYLCAAEWFRNVEAEEVGVRGAHRSHRANL